MYDNDANGVSSIESASQRNAMKHLMIDNGQLVM